MSVTPSRQLSVSGNHSTSYSTSLKSPSPSPSFLSSSFSARDSYFDDLERSDDHAVESKSYEQGTSPHDASSASGDNAHQSGKYHLDIEVINYIAKQSPLLASLASLLRSPTSRFDPEFLETALSRSRVSVAVHTSCSYLITNALYRSATPRSSIGSARVLVRTVCSEPYFCSHIRHSMDSHDSSIPTTTLFLIWKTLKKARKRIVNPVRANQRKTRPMNCRKVSNRVRRKNSMTCHHLHRPRT